MPPRKPHFTSPPFREHFNQIVWEIVTRIPRGKVMTYGAIAKQIPRPRPVGATHYNAARARWVGGAMAASPKGVPWHRVINSQGKISIRPNNNHHVKQRHLLEAEGVEFDYRGRIDLERFGWSPDRRKRNT